MRISQLEYFVSAARNLSFTKAAKECFTVQSAVSQQVTALEAELGFSLFERGAKGLTLTQAGERYYADTVRLLHQLSENQRTAAQIANGIHGSLKVGIAGANQAAFMGSLKRFYQDNPALSVIFCDVSTEHQVQELRDRRYDLLYTAAFNMRGMDAEIALAERRHSVLAVFMNKEHPLARQENVTLEELARWPNIYAGIPENGRSFSTEQDLFVGSGLRPIRTLYVRDQNISGLLLDLNIGVAVGPEELLTSMPRGVVRRPLEQGRYSIELGWAYLRSNTNPALLRLLTYFSHQESR